ncbi:MAG: hypothetical protein WA324_27515, partial [Bryobacteraceae bacterium]
LSAFRPPLLLLLRRLGFGKLLARFNRRGIARDMADQPVLLGARDERGVQALRQLAFSKLLKTA